MLGYGPAGTWRSAEWCLSSGRDEIKDVLEVSHSCAGSTRARPAFCVVKLPGPLACILAVRVAQTSKTLMQSDG